MGTFSDMHTETLYYRAPSTNATAANSFAAPTWGAATAYTANIEAIDSRSLLEQGHTNVLGYRIQTHTALAPTYLLFGPGDDGATVSTGRVPVEVKNAPLGPIGETDTLYEATV